MADPAPQTPEWWLNKLSKELAHRQNEMGLMDRYYTGDHPLPFLTRAHSAKMRDEFRQLLDDSRSNFMRLVVDVVAERLNVEGIRLSAETDPVADAATWRIWQANQMDGHAQTAFIEALVKGVSYISVWAPDDADGYPTLAVEDPLETIVGYVPGSNYTQRAAALKTWRDDWTGKLRANVYLPDGIYKYEAPPDKGVIAAAGGPGAPPPVANVANIGAQPRWKPLDDPKDQPFVKNPTGIVPIIPLRNQPRLGKEGASELADIFLIQNRINGTLFLRALAAYVGAHRQRWAVGLKLMEDENTGQQMEPFDAAIDRIWQSENPEVKFGEFEQTDLQPYISAIEQEVLHIAVLSRTPRHYLIQQGQSPSGDAIESAEAGLVKKVEKKQFSFGEGLEEALGLARRFAGETDVPVDSEIVWGDPATESEAVRTDAVIKQYAGGLIPWEAALERLGFTQTEIERFSKMRLSDVLLQGIANPSPPVNTNIGEQSMKMPTVTGK